MMVRLIPILVLFVAGLPGSTPRLCYWIENPLEKVRPFDSLPRDPQRVAEVYAARNEFEPFQIVLRSIGKDEPQVDVAASDLHGDQGAVIGKENIAIYFEHSINVKRPSTEGGSVGPWPDALIPRVDRYANEPRNAFPFDLVHDCAQPLWVDVFVPANAFPGKYSASLRVSSLGKTRLTIPIELTVWQFSLPSTSTLKSSFGFSGVLALKAHRGSYTNDQDLYSITRLYAKAALENRISIQGGSLVPPKIIYHSGKLEIDWTAYDAEVAPALDGMLITGDDPLRGAKATSIDLRMPSSFENDDERRQYWIAFINHFQKKGWLDRLFLYLWDEPKEQDFTKALALARDSMRADPRMRNLITMPYQVDFKDVVSVWVPLVNCLEKKPGHDDFCSLAPALDVYNTIGPHSSLWVYQSCASHGCNIVGGEYFNGWPSYMIDTPGAANRVMEWISWKFAITGELYYSMNEAYRISNDPWTDLRLFGGNGDGTLFYPGTPSRIGGHTDIPIESIRLKLIREGMEDYEYLALLERLSGRDAAAEYVNRIVTAPYQWESRSDEFLRVRRDLGEKLDRLSRTNPASHPASHETHP